MNILIADDEELMRTSLHLYLENEHIPGACIYHAENAADMQKHFTEYKIDIAFIDIRMPGTDGLTAIETCKKIQPETHFYVLTGYSEFEYAHKALQLHIEDYLLKPVSPEQLHRILQKELLYFQTQASQKQNEYARILTQVLRGQSTASLPISAAIVCFSGTMGTEAFHELIASIHTSLCCNFHQEILHCSFLSWEYFILPQGNIPEKMVPFLNQKIRHLPCSLFLASGTDGRHTALTLQSLQADSMRLLLTPFGICHTSVNGPASFRTLGQAFACLLDSLKEKNFDQFCLMANRFTSVLNQEKDSLENKVTGQLIDILNHFFGDPQYTAAHLDDIPQLLNMFAVNHLLSPSSPNNNLLSIKQYIEAHYQERITLPELSERFGYTPNYISSAFRKYTGLTVTQYLNQIRLSNVCRLLTETDLTIQEIAEATGFSDSNYLTRMFHQQYHCSPTSYRQK